MKRTQFTDARRNIRRQLVPWISIVVIGTVALLAYLSLAYCGAAIRRNLSAYYNTQNAWDFELVSSLMMDEEDLAAISAVPGVEKAEPVWTANAHVPALHREAEA